MCPLCLYLLRLMSLLKNIFTFSYYEKLLPQMEIFYIPLGFLEICLSHLD